jgi:hypothetical protein
MSRLVASTSKFFGADEYGDATKKLPMRTEAERRGTTRMIRVVDPNVLAVLLPLGMACYLLPSLNYAAIAAWW